MTSLRPFWAYYGGKWRAAPRYPRPMHDTIIEPFAGAAGYSLRYPDRNVVLVELCVHGVDVCLVPVVPAALVVAQRKERRQGGGAHDASELRHHGLAAWPRQQVQVKDARL